MKDQWITPVLLGVSQAPAACKATQEIKLCILVKIQGPRVSGPLAWHTGPLCPCPCSALQPHSSLQPLPYLMLLSYQDASYLTIHPAESPFPVLPPTAPFFYLECSSVLLCSLGANSSLTSAQESPLSRNEDSLFWTSIVHLMSICSTSTFISSNVCHPYGRFAASLLLSTQPILFMANKCLLKKRI